MILFGASGHCRVVLDILFQNHNKISFIYDDFSTEKLIYGIPVCREINNIQPAEKAIITIGNNLNRKIVASRFPQLEFVTAIHSKATVSPRCEISHGTVVMANAVINPNASIGKHCVINSGAIIEHDCKIADFVHISPNASVAGNVSIEEGAHVGIGASIIQGVKIGKWSIIGAGSVVIRDVPDYAVVVGNPSKIIKQNKENL